MVDRAPADNWGYVCDVHAPRPDPRYAQMDPAAFLGRYVKWAFAVRASAAQEHMWVQVRTVTPEGHRRHVPWLVYGLPTCSPAPPSSWIS